MKVAVLDVNETLFTLDTVGAALDAVGLGADRLELWFARVLRDGFAVAAMGRTVAFPDLVDHHVRDLGNQIGTAIGDTEVDRVIAAFGEVRAQPDVAEGLHRLREAEVRLVPFTNGSTAIVEGFLERSGLAALCEAPRGVDAAGAWKPRPDAYRWVCSEAGVALGEAAIVSVHPWDVAGGAEVGMLGAWLDRGRSRWPHFLTEPHFSGQSLPALVEVMLR